MTARHRLFALQIQRTHDPFLHVHIPLFCLLRIQFIAIAGLVILLEIPTLTLAQATSQTFNASGTYVVPAGYTTVVKGEVWGSGSGFVHFCQVGPRQAGSRPRPAGLVVFDREVIT